MQARPFFIFKGNVEKPSDSPVRETPMPRYYVRLEPQGITDKDGEELPGPEAAKRLAERVAQDLAKHREELPYQSLVVIDERGEVVHEKALMLH